MNIRLKHFRIAMYVVSLFCIITILLIIAFIIKKENEYLRIHDLDVVFETSDIINIKNKLPLADEVAKYYEGIGFEENIEAYSKFSISNPNDRKITYEIYLNKQDTTSSIDSHYIKFYLTDNDNTPYKGFELNKIPSFYDFYVLNDKPGSKLLYRGTLLPLKKADFKLRMWLADTYALNSNEEDFKVDIDVRIK